MWHVRTRDGGKVESGQAGKEAQDATLGERELVSVGDGVGVSPGDQVEEEWVQGAGSCGGRSVGKEQTPEGTLAWTGPSSEFWSGVGSENDAAWLSWRGWRQWDRAVDVKQVTEDFAAFLGNFDLGSS
jgi:hypothetical protein